MPSSNSTLSSRSTSERTASFICEIPLRVTPEQACILSTRLEVARQVYNACLGEMLRRARLLRERRSYRQAARLPKGAGRTTAFRAARRSVEFTDAATQR